MGQWIGSISGDSASEMDVDEGESVAARLRARKKKASSSTEERAPKKARSKPKAEPKPAAKAAAKVEPKAKASSSKNVTQTTAKDEVKQEPKEESKPEPKTTPKMEPKAEPVIDVKAEESKKKAPESSSATGPAVDAPARELGVCVYLDYDAKLNQTIVDGPVNSNKFYIIQVLQKGSQYACWNRWGRVGEPGATNLSKLKWGSADSAVADFEKKFKDKSGGNQWHNRTSFVKRPGKYQLVEVEDGDEADAASGAALGKLTREQIEKGQAVLNEIRTLLESKGKVPSSLTNAFYSLIPTVSGRSKPPMINDFDILGEKEAQLEFWLRMGFEEVKVTTTDNPLEKLAVIACPADLMSAARAISDSHSITSSIKRGTTLAKSQAGAPVEQMDAHKYAAIVLYTGNSIYRALNEALRIKHAQVPRYLPYIKLFFSAAESMPKKPAKLWRGIAADLYDEYEPGKVITWWTVSSTTASEAVARGFMQQLGGKATLLTLETETSMNIEPLSIYPHERESLLIPGTKLKVLSRTRKGSLAEIGVKEVGNALAD